MAAANESGKLRTVVTWTLRIILGLIFLAIGAEKLTGTQGTVEYFAAIGWGQWFRYLTGFLDVVGAVLIFAPRWTFYGALVITCSVRSGILFSFTIWHRDPATWSPVIIWIPLVLTLLAVTLAWRTRPRRAG